MFDSWPMELERGHIQEVTNGGFTQERFMIKRRTHSRESETARNKNGWMIEIIYKKHEKDWKTLQFVDTFCCIAVYTHCIY